MSEVKVIDLTLRDGHQSIAATRMRTRDMIPVLELIDEAGFYSIEMWGGATFDAPLRFLREDPWERLRIIRSKIKKTKLMMLLRGQNLVGLISEIEGELKSEVVEEVIEAEEQEVVEEETKAEEPSEEITSKEEKKE